MMFAWTVFIGCMIAAGATGDKNGNALAVKVVNLSEVRRVDLAEKPKDSENSFNFSSAGFRDNTLTMTLELRGNGVVDATHYGKIAVKSARDDRGRPLKLHEQFSVGLDDPREGFVAIDREMMFFMQSDPPKDVIRVDLLFELPERDAKNIATVAGSIAIRSGKIRELTTDSIKAWVGKTLADKTLEQAGLRVQVLDPSRNTGSFFAAGQSDAALTFDISGEVTNLLDLKLTTASGDSISTSTMWSESGSTKQITLQGDVPIPADAKLKLRVVTDSRVIDVPLALSDIRLP